jgi:hypothetical protein
MFRPPDSCVRPIILRCVTATGFGAACTLRTLERILAG